MEQILKINIKTTTFNIILFRFIIFYNNTKLLKYT